MKSKVRLLPYILVYEVPRIYFTSISHIFLGRGTCMYGKSVLILETKYLVSLTPVCFAVYRILFLILWTIKISCDFLKSLSPMHYAETYKFYHIFRCPLTFFVSVEICCNFYIICCCYTFIISYLFVFCRHECPPLPALDPI